MSISEQEIAAIYELAALSGDERERAAMKEHFEKMFRHLEDLSRIPVGEAIPYFLLPHRDLPREADVPREPLSASALRRTFAQETEGFLVVPRVVNRGSDAENGEEE